MFNLLDTHRTWSRAIRARRRNVGKKLARNIELLLGLMVNEYERDTSEIHRNINDGGQSTRLTRVLGNNPSIAGQKKRKEKRIDVNVSLNRTRTMATPRTGRRRGRRWIPLRKEKTLQRNSIRSDFLYAMMSSSILFEQSTFSIILL